MFKSNLRRWFVSGCAALLLIAGLNAPAMAQQSENHGLHAVPPPGPVVIDGKLNDWDLSGQFEVFANYRTRSTYSTKVAAMYDKDYFYISIVWRDPTPLQNMVDSNFEVGSGWKSDCVQLRLFTDAPMHIDCWYSTTAKKPVINIQHGSYERKSPLAAELFNKNPFPNAIDAGALEAFTVGEDGKSYTQEIALPWKLITAQAFTLKSTGKPLAPAREFKAGDKFKMGMEFLWGGPDGRTFPIHRYADLVTEGTSSREFFWETEKAWGPVILEPKGNLKLPEPDYASRMEAYLQKTSGPVKLNYTMPFDGFATLVIEDEKGQRVRNLIGMAPRSKGPQVDFWDCTNDKGQLVQPGNYRFRGLTHQGIEPTYDATYGTPGVPPWDTGDGTGAWLSDHTPPRAVAASKDMMILAAERGESGYAIIGTDSNGRKKWGDRTFHGIDRIGADDEYVYLFENAWDVQKPAIARLVAATGKYAPFDTKSGSQLRVAVNKEGEKKPGWTPGFAVGPKEIAVALPGEKATEKDPAITPRIRIFDKKNCEFISDRELPNVGVIAYDSAGTLFIWTDSKLTKLVDGKLQDVINTPDQKWPTGIAIDSAGRIFLSDNETKQVRVYDAAGKFLNTIGKEGGRPARGAWEPNGLMNPTGLAIDSKGNVWVAEMDSNPKRISVWTADGKLAKDYIGPTGYGGGGANADPDDKTRVFGSGCEFKLDYKDNKATVVSALGPVAGEFIKANGREYFMSKEGRLFMRDGEKLRFVAAMGNPGVKDYGQWKDIPLPPATKDTHGYATISFVWSDANDDGVAQPEEVVTGSGWTKWNVLKYPVGVNGYFGSYWLDKDFNLYGWASESFGAWGGRGPFATKIPLKSWTKGGAPIFDLENQKLLAQPKGLGGALYLPADGKIVVGSPLTCITDDGKIQWTFTDKFAGVHGSHDAPIPERDDTMVGSLGCIGRANTSLGTVFAMHSNMGRMYLMTMDGLFVASVFQDSRLGSEPWPNEARPGAPLGGVTMGSEWFGGHFFKAEKTNEYYLIAGFTAYNMIKLNGFDKLQAISGTPLTVTGADVVAGQELIQKNLALNAAKTNLVITKAAAPMTVDAKLDSFPADSFVSWSSGPFKLSGALAYDDTNLYLGVKVQGDDNPAVNGGKDVQQLFVTGDSVNLHLGTDASADPARKEPALGDLRLLLANFEGKPTAVLYRWKVKDDKAPVLFTCPWRNYSVDRVDVLSDVKINITKVPGGYTLKAVIPLAAIAFKPEAGKEYKLDLGVIFSDAKGDNRAARVYWANKSTGLVADVPGEIMPETQLWGKAKVAP